LKRKRKFLRSGRGGKGSKENIKYQISNIKSMSNVKLKAIIFDAGGVYLKGSFANFVDKACKILRTNKTCLMLTVKLFLIQILIKA